MAMPQATQDIQLIVGLGNPGAQYESTRHNVGFMVVDALAEKLSVSYWKQAHGALIAEVNYQGRRIVLAKPQSFMNASGGPVKKIMQAYDCNLSEILVIHDELDIPEGTARIKQGGGHAGHNGLRSIIDKCLGRDFCRVRVGIGRPPGKMPVADFVLSTPRHEAAEQMELACDRALLCVEEVLLQGPVKAMNKMNVK